MKRLAYALVLLGSLTVATPALASHSWSGYHLARTANPFTLRLGDNVTSAWDSYLLAASLDWTTSNTLDTSVVRGSTTARTCRAVSGTVQVCNSAYGNTGWLGVAQIWINGSHITAGIVKLNDTYFRTNTYNTPGWRRMVACQEVGHTFGLGHQDEGFSNANLGTCMDYTNNPARNDGAGDNLRPNTHDYDQLELIYAHLDTFNSYVKAGVSTGFAKAALESALANNDISNISGLLPTMPTTPTIPAIPEVPNIAELVPEVSDWGSAVGVDVRGRVDEFERDFGRGQKVLTHVFWIQE